jgi:hypothetical protein
MRRQVVKLSAVLVTSLVLLAFTVTTAFAAAPHFISASASINGGGSLVVSWKEAGLGDNLLIHYTISADATATYVCVNGGNHNPSASNKTTVSGPVSASGTFSSGKNGNITASLSAGPPSAGGFSCPNGQKLELALVTYSNITLTDTTNNISVDLGTRSSGCLLPNVKGAC